MNSKRIQAFFFAGILATVNALFAGSVYYVNPDPAVGNDSYDGTSPTVGEGLVGPKLTLAALKDIGAGTEESFNEIHLAPGVYSNKTCTMTKLWSATIVCRAKFPAYTKVVCDGPRGSAVIMGASSADVEAVNGCGTDAVRCFYNGGNVRIVGVTLSGGRTDTHGTKDYTNSGGAYIGVDAPVYLINCTVTNCVAYVGGGVGYYGGCTAINTLFVDNHACRANGGNCFQSYSKSSAIHQHNFYNCVFIDNACSADPNDNYNPGNLSYAVNCFFESGHRGAVAVNSVFLGNTGDYAILSNCLYVANKGSGVKGDRFTKVSATEIPYDPATFRPLAGSRAIDQGDLAYYAAYKALLPGDLQPYLEKDFAGGGRVLDDGLDIGPGEFKYNWFPLAANTGLTTTLVDGVLSIVRNFTSDRLCTAFTFDGVRIVFAEHPEGYVYTTTIKGDIAYTDPPVPEYVDTTEWYLDPVLGNDAAGGYRPECPKRTLASLSTLADGCESFTNIIHLAPGVYAEGLVTNLINAIKCYFRAKFPAYTKVICDAGKGAAVIVGAAATENADEYGCGDNAVRCFYSGGEVHLIGVALTEGHTRNGTDTVQLRRCGGAYLGEQPVYLVDCVASNNVAQCIGGVSSIGTAAINCLFTGNRCQIAGSTYVGGNCFKSADRVTPCSFYNCVFADNHGGDDFDNYDPVGTAVNCLFEGGNRGAPAMNCIFLGMSGDWATLTNCLYVTGGGTGVKRTACKQVTLEQIPFDPVTYRPLRASLAANAANRDLYDAAWESVPFEYRSYKDVDFAGGDRVARGGLDIGPGERQPSGLGLTLLLK